MIQEITPYKFDNQYRTELPEDNSYILMYENRQIWMKTTEGGIVFPTVKDLRKDSGLDRAIYLFSVDEQKFFMIRDLDTTGYESFGFYPLNELRTAKPGYLAYAGAVGHQLYTWYQSRKFCGSCGAPMEHSLNERMLQCTSCEQKEYPKICPAVIVGIIHGDQLLLSKYEGRDYKRYALIAGFAEIGETIEETVHREVMEEVGLKVKNLRFYKSQPWPFTDTLLMGFYCDLDGEEQITLDRQELSMAAWMNRSDIPDEGENISLTKEMMMNFKRGDIC